MSVRKKPFEFGVDGYTDAPPEVDEALRKAIPVDDVMFPSPEACAKAIHGRRKVHVFMMVDSETVEAFRDMAEYRLPDPHERGARSLCKERGATGLIRRCFCSACGVSDGGPDGLLWQKRVFRSCFLP